MYCIVNKYNVTLYICHLWINNSRDCRFCKSRRWYVPSKGGPRWRRVPRLLWQLLLQERGWPKISTTINSNVVTFRPRYLMNGSVLKSLWPCCSWLEYIEIVVLFKKSWTVIGRQYFSIAQITWSVENVENIQWDQNVIVSSQMTLQQQRVLSRATALDGQRTVTIANLAMPRIPYQWTKLILGSLTSWETLRFIGLFLCRDIKAGKVTSSKAKLI